MMHRYIDETLEHLSDHDSGGVYEGVVLERCVLHHVGMNVHSVTRRTRIRHATLRECTMYTNCWLGPAIVEEVLLDNCPRRTGSTGFIAIDGAALRHVTFRGRIVPFYLHYRVAIPDPTKRFGLMDAPEFIEDNVRFYRDVDWALDITEAQLGECGLAGVPGHLVRFDPRTAALVRRESLAGKSDELLLDLALAGAPLSFRDLSSGPYDSVVAVANTLAPKKKRQEQLDALQRLRDEGIADPA